MRYSLTFDLTNRGVAPRAVVFQIGRVSASKQNAREAQNRNELREGGKKNHIPNLFILLHGGGGKGWGLGGGGGGGFQAIRFNLAAAR